MMEFNEFKDALKEALYEKLDLERIEEKVINKNGEDRDAFILYLNNDSNISPTLYVSDIYKDSDHYDSVEDIAESLSEEFNGKLNNFYFDTELVSNYELARNNLRIKIINAERNKALLEEVPHKMVCDLAVICTLFVSSKEIGKGSIKINDKILNNWGITEEQLFKDALENSSAVNPYSLKTMASVIESMTGQTFDSPVPSPYILSSTDKCFGASCIYYPSVLKLVSEKLGEDHFYILPSSVHEVIIITEHECEQDIEVLRAMVKEVNSTVLKSDDFLSDNVYRYDAKKDLLSIA